APAREVAPAFTQADLDAVSAEIDRLYLDHYRNRTVSKETFDAVMVELDARRAEIEAALNQAPATVAAKSAEITRAEWERGDIDIDLRRAWLQRFLDAVWIGGDLGSRRGDLDPRRVTVQFAERV